MDTLYVTKRTYFRNEAGLGDTEEAFPNITAMVELSRQYSFTASMAISSEESKLDPAQKERAKVLVEKIRDLGIEVSYDPNGQTALSKFQEACFPRKTPARNVIRAICCLDQYPLYTKEQVEVALELAEKTQKDGALYGSGSRGVPVVLGVNKKPSDMRIIHELAQLLATDYPEQFRVFDKPNWTNPSPPYDDLGEFTPGFYFFNPAHSAYPALAREIQGRQDLINKVGFSLEYLAAGTAGNIKRGVATGYVHAVRNPFDIKPTEGEELKSTSNWISAQTQQVGSTSFGPHLRRFLADSERQQPLVDLFGEDLVTETLEIMRKAAT